MGLRRDDSMKPGSAGQEAGGRSDLSKDLTAATPSPGAGVRRAPASSIASGTMLGHFEVLDLLGAGGFGEVYRARDTRLERMVAIKVLPEEFARDAEVRERFRREAIAASALKHPNICTVHEFAETNGRHLIVMELVEGKTLHAVLGNGPLPVAAALPIALQIGDALAHAHRAGILHRDIKSGNIALTERGQVKVLDFGLAKLFGPAPEAEGSTVEKLTAEGATLGTITHMSPEQLLGKQVDRRSDLFSFGVVLYEMVTGLLPFQGSTTIAVADAILHAEPRDFGEKPPPAKLKAIIWKLLEKDPAKRHATAEEVHTDLKAVEASLTPAHAGGLSRNVRIAVAVGIVVLAILAGWYWRKSSRERWALAQIPEISRLVEVGDWARTVGLLMQTRAILPEDPQLEKLWLQATMEVSIDSSPQGADVLIRSFRGPAASWQLLGQTPLVKAHVPRGDFVWRIAKKGFVEQSVLLWPWQTVQLDQDGSVPDGMVRVRVRGGKTDLFIPGMEHLPEIALDDYLIDRTEVTNGDYKKFVDAGGYDKPKYWKEPFVWSGRTIPFEDAVARFRDSAGRPGPATWEAGGFPKQLENHPVTGVSWFEAAAYAEFAGKGLPTIYHWDYAAQPWSARLIVPGSNFQNAGTVPVGGDEALSGFGTSDMAGNVKEWCLNEAREGTRFILGGGFGEPSYMFVDPDAQSPWDRRPNFGFRCVKLSSPSSPAAAARIEPAFRDYLKEKPVSDDVFAAYKGLYSYDKGELNARVEETQTTEEWTREKVSFDAAYGGERVVAHVFLPKGVRPPYQTVVVFPPSNAIFMDHFPLPRIPCRCGISPSSSKVVGRWSIPFSRAPSKDEMGSARTLRPRPRSGATT